MKQDEMFYPWPQFNASIANTDGSGCGVTKREMFAAMILQGLLSNGSYPSISKHAVEFADELIAQLDAKKDE